MTTNELPGDTRLPSPKSELDALAARAGGDFKYSVEDFFRKAEHTAFKISPEGGYLSYLAPYERRMNVHVRPTEDIGATHRLTSIVDRDISAYFWISESRLGYIKDAGGDENFKLYAVNVDGTEHTDLTPYDDVRIQIIDDLPQDDDHIIIGMNRDNPMLFTPYRLDVNNGSLTALAVNDNVTEPYSQYLTDHAGRLRLATKVIDGVNSEILYRDDEHSEFKPVLRTDFTESVRPLFFDFEEDHIIYISSNLGRDKSVITRMDARTGIEIGPVLYEHPEVDVTGLRYSRAQKKLQSIPYYTDRRGIHYLDAEWEQLMDRVRQKIDPELEFGITSTTRDENILILRSYSDRSLGDYYILRRDPFQLEHLESLSPWLDPSDMAVKQTVYYRSRDGLKIQGYLSVPPGADGPLPVIVHPHGGPWVRDHWQYHPAIQCLCSRGYAVFQMNYRGSTGYGKKFWMSSFKQWGLAMQDDITDGVQHLIDTGIADKDRIAIYGGSYGGYATLAGVSFTPDLYCCAIDYVGVSNLLTFLKTIPPYWKPYLEMMYTMVGHPEEDEEAMQAASPAYHVDKIKVPLLVIQGANDPRVNIDESDQIVRNLRARDIHVPYMVKYDEGHGFHNEENIFEVYKVMLGFLAQHV